VCAVGNIRTRNDIRSMFAQQDPEGIPMSYDISTNGLSSLDATSLDSFLEFVRGALSSVDAESDGTWDDEYAADEISVDGYSEPDDAASDSGPDYGDTSYSDTDYSDTDYSDTDYSIDVPYTGYDSWSDAEYSYGSTDSDYLDWSASFEYAYDYSAAVWGDPNSW
jgi:hypothetical protein